jgi:hypothetical protein
MTIRNATMKNTLAAAYKGAAPYGALFSADPGTAGAATNELSGGSYARAALNWGTPSGGVVTSAATVFNVASGATVAYFGGCTSATATTADVQDSVAVTSQTFASAGTYTVTATYTQS